MKEEFTLIKSVRSYSHLGTRRDVIYHVSWWTFMIYMLQLNTPHADQDLSKNFWRVETFFFVPIRIKTKRTVSLLFFLTFIFHTWQGLGTFHMQKVMQPLVLSWNLCNLFSFGQLIFHQHRFFCNNTLRPWISMLLFTHPDSFVAMMKLFF